MNITFCQLVNLVLALVGEKEGAVIRAIVAAWEENEPKCHDLFEQQVVAKYIRSSWFGVLQGAIRVSAGKSLVDPNDVLDMRFQGPGPFHVWIRWADSKQIGMAVGDLSLTAGVELQNAVPFRSAGFSEAERETETKVKEGAEVWFKEALQTNNV